MLPPWLFYAILFLVAGHALWRGGQEERLIGVACLVAALITPMVMPEATLLRYQQVEWGVVTVDLLLLLVMVVVALRSERFWPLWVAGLQLTTLMAHLAKLVSSDLVLSYAAAARFWAYPILLILAIATLRRPLYDNSPPFLSSTRH